MKLYMILLSLILLSFPVVAGPYCINGPVGDLNINITEINGHEEEICVDLQGCDVEYEVYHNGNSTIEVRVQWELVNLNNNLTILNGSDTRGLSANRTERENFELELPGGLNESDDYIVIIKSYQIYEPWGNQTSLESTNCDDDSETIDIVNYREIEVKNVSITPNNLDCDTDSFTVTATLFNNFSHTEDISLKIYDGLGILDLEYNSDNFSMANGETKIISNTFDLPGFHLYKHSFQVMTLSNNIHNRGYGSEVLKIDKCSTDNAQNLQERVPKLVSKLQRIERLFTKLCTFLSNQGYNC